MTGAVLVASAIVVWSNTLTPRPLAAQASPTSQPAGTTPASPSPRLSGDPAWTFQTTAGGPEVRVRYRLPEGLDLTVGEHPGYLSFTAGDHSVGFDQPIPAAATGLRIVDATWARPHYNNDQPLGEDAATFIHGLATNERVGLELGPVSAAHVGGSVAWSVDLTAPAGDRGHLDAVDPISGGGESIDLVSPSRLLVFDMDSAIILVQLWAGPQADFDGWLADAQPLLRSLRIDVTPADGASALDLAAGPLSTRSIPSGWRLVRTGAVGVGLAAGDVLLASNYDTSEVFRHDRATLEDLGTIEVGPRGVFPPDAQSLAPGKGGVWVTLASQAAIGLLDPVSGDIVRRIALDAWPYDLFEHEGELWIIDYEHDALTRMNRRTEEVMAKIQVEKPTDVVVGEGAVWATVHVGRAGQFEPIPGNEGRIARIDPATNEVVALLDVGPRPYFLATGFGAAWTGNATGASVSRIDAVTNEVTTIPISQDGAFDIEVVGDSVWVIVGEQYWAPPCDPDTSFFVRIDPTTSTVRERIAFPCPGSLTVDGDRLWVSGSGKDGPVVALFEPAD